MNGPCPDHGIAPLRRQQARVKAAHPLRMDTVDTVLLVLMLGALTGIAAR